MHIRVCLETAIAVFTLGVMAPAQSSPIDRSSTLIGGGISISKMSMGYIGNTEDYTEVLFNPSVKYFIADGLALGVGLRYWSIDEADEFGFTINGSYHFQIGQPLSRDPVVKSIKGAVLPFIGIEYAHNLPPNILYFFSDDFDAISFWGGSDIMVSNNAAVNLQVEYSSRFNEPQEYVFGPSFEGASKSMIRFLAGFSFFIYDDKPNELR
jgi:hypothetical protein